ncbi:MAG: AsmA family protein [Pontiellaceae bacterium]
MKLVLRFFGALLISIFVICLLFMFTLNGILATWVYPSIEKQTDMQMQSSKASYNPISGWMRVSNLMISNPPNYEEPILAAIPVLELKLKPTSLFGGGAVVIEQARIDRGVVNLIRNKKGVLNVQEVQQKLIFSGEKSEIKGVPIPSVKDPKEPIEILLNILIINSDIYYVDHQIPDLNVLLHMAVSGEQVSTVPDHEWGSIQIMGELLSDRSSFKTHISLAMAPIIDPQKLSFDLEGRVLEIDPRLIAKTSDKLGIQMAPFGIDPQIVCRGGKLEGSEVAIRLHDLVFPIRGNTTKVNQLQLAVPLSGTLQDPIFDLNRAFREAVGGNTASILSSVIGGLVEDLDILEEPVKVLTDGVVEVLDQPLKEITKEASAIVEVGLGLFGDLIQMDSDETTTNQLKPSSTEDLKKELESLGIKLF